MPSLLVQLSSGSVSCYVMDGRDPVSPEVVMTADDARQAAEGLLACAALIDGRTKRPDPKAVRLKIENRVEGLERHLTKLRRDQQQLLTALQEVARKVARLDGLMVTDVRMPRVDFGSDIAELLAATRPVNVATTISIDEASKANTVARGFFETLKTAISGTPAGSAPC